MANGLGSQYSSHYLGNMVYPALLPLMLTPRLPVVYWTDAPDVLNGLVLFAERRNLVSTRVQSHFKRSLRNEANRIWTHVLSAWTSEHTCPRQHNHSTDFARPFRAERQFRYIYEFCIIL